MADRVALESRLGVDAEHPMRMPVPEMIGDKKRPMVEMNFPVEVVEDEETVEPMAGGIERVGNPPVEITVGGWRRVVGDDRRPFRIIVVVDDLLVDFGDDGGLGRHRFTGTGNLFGIWGDRQTKPGQDVIKFVQRPVPIDRQLTGISDFGHGQAQFAGYVGSNRIIGNPAVFRGDPDSGKTALRLGFLGDISHSESKDQLDCKLTLPDQLLPNRRESGAGLRHLHHLRFGDHRQEE